MSSVLEASLVGWEANQNEILSDRQVGWYDVAKRVCDVVVATFALVALSPLLVVIAVLIKLTDFGPALFVQMRVGKGGRPFRCYKLRSMVQNAERLKQTLSSSNHHEDHRTFKMVADPRITWIGRFIRKTSLDEVPQLWNVLLGDMSLVGPRPPVPSEVARYSPLDLRRLEVRPGLTCIWQVSGRANLPFQRQVELDIEYIEQMSLWLDLQLLLRTVPAVISGHGAY